MSDIMYAVIIVVFAAIVMGLLLVPVMAAESDPVQVVDLAPVVDQIQQSAADIMNVILFAAFSVIGAFCGYRLFVR